MKKTILLFAAAKEIAGTAKLELELDDVATVAMLRETLVQQFPELSDLVARSSIAIDHQYAANDHLIAPAQEIGLIPPVSGG